MGYPSNSDSVAQDQIRAFVERVERIESEVKDLNKDKSEVYAEAKGNGFDVPALKHVIKLRRQDAADRAEREAIIELYMAALGMAALPANWGGDDDSDETGTVDATRAPARPNSNPVTHAAGQGEGTAPGSLANQSTAARMDVPGSPPVIENGPVPGENGDRYPVNGEAKVLAASSEVPGTPAGTQAPPVDTLSSEAEVRQMRDDWPDRQIAPTAADNARKIRPWCLHADDLGKCGGYGHTHCHSCLVAHADAEGLSA